MKIKGKLSYIRLFVPVLLFAGVPIFAQATADSRMPASSASHKMTGPNADVLLISDRTFLMKSIAGITANQSFKSQSADTIARPISLYELAGPGCSSRIFSFGAAKSLSSGRCPIIDCAAPPPGCFYQGPPDTGPNGCPINCGHLVCGPESN